MTASSMWVIAAPLAALLTGIFSLFFWGKARPQRWLNLVGALVHLTCSLFLLSRVQELGPQVIRLGGWAAPYGIAYVADTLSALLLVVTGGLASLLALYNFQGGIDVPRENFGYHALTQFLIFGVSGAFVSGDIFHLYVCFEILLMSSFGLMVLGNERAQLVGAFKYLIMNLISSMFFVAAVGLLYSQLGTLSIADLSLKLSAITELPVSLQLVSHLLFVAFGVKAALFPLFFWLPSSYHTPPVPVTALMGGLMTKVGTYSLIRLYTLIFPHSGTGTFAWIWWVSVFTMVIGVIGAVSKGHIRRILSVHIISQVGYVTLALALKTPLALAAAVFYMIHNMIAKPSLLLIGGIVESYSGTDYLKRCGGLYKAKPLLAIFFLVSALGLAGLPPFSGFFAKLFVIYAAAEIDSYSTIAAALGVSVFTLFSMLKIWNEAFWKAAPEECPGPPATNFARSWLTPQMLAVGVLSMSVLLMGVFAGPIFEVLLRASAELMSKYAYIEAVMGPVGGAQ